MKLKDSTIISLLFFTWLCITIGVLGAEAEIDRLEQQIDTLYNAQNYTSEAIAELKQYDSIQDERMAEIERYNRIQDYRLAMHHNELEDNAEMFTDLLDSVERLEEHMRSLPDNAVGVTVSEQDIRDIAALVYLEAGSSSCSYELQKAIASVIFNQMKYYGLNAQQTIYRPGAFSPASRVKRTTPSARCVMAVREVLETGCTLPDRVIAFQLNGYHSFGTPYTRIQNVFFTKV